MKEDVPKIGILEYFIDMDIGTCSCSQGSNGAACKHQAAVAKHFKIASVNIAPIHSKQARKIYATGKTMCLEHSNKIICSQFITYICIPQLWKRR